MGIIDSLIGRRLRKIDQARVDLFDLNETEFPVEGQAMQLKAGWPAAFGLPLPPSDAESVTASASILMDGLRVLLP